MIDCHCHLADKEFESDISDVIERAKNEGVIAAVVVPEFLSDFERVLNLSDLFKDFIFPCFGIHPVQGNFESANPTIHFEGVEEIIEKNLQRLHGIGEIGLDFSPRYLKKGDVDKKNQREIFKRQIELANKYNLTLNVHSRSACRPTIEFLKENSTTKVLLHAFDGSVKNADIAIESGYYFSIPPSFTITDSKKELIERIPMEQLCLESDSPVLGPVRGERNEPKNVRLSAEYISRVKNIPLEEVICQTTKNAKLLFRIP